MSDEQKAQELISFFVCERDYEKDELLQFVKILQEDELIEKNAEAE